MGEFVTVTDGNSYDLHLREPDNQLSSSESRTGTASQMLSLQPFRWSLAARDERGKLAGRSLHIPSHIQLDSDADISLNIKALSMIGGGGPAARYWAVRLAIQSGDTSRGMSGS
jgi:hypothetical protein